MAWAPFNAGSGRLSRARGRGHQRSHHIAGPMMKQSNYGFLAILLCSCHATVRPIVGAPVAAYREPTMGREYAEPCNPSSFQQRDGGLLIGGTGTVLLGTASLVGSNWIGSSQRRADARKPLTAVTLAGLGMITVGGVLVWDDDSPHQVCEMPENPAGSERP